MILLIPLSGRAKTLQVLTALALNNVESLTELSSFVTARANGKLTWSESPSHLVVVFDLPDSWFSNREIWVELP